MSTVLSIALLAALIGSIPYGIWVVYTAFRKRWKRLGYQIGIPLVLLSALLGISSMANARAYDRYLQRLFDTKVKLGSPVFEYNSRRAFNGDGYSIAVYSLPSSIKARFASVDEKLLSEFPKHPSHRNRWVLERWRRSPFDARFNDYLNFALSSSDIRNASELSRHFDAIRAALKREGAFYAFFYYNPSGHLGNVDFFIVDLNEGRLYLMNLNT